MYFGQTQICPFQLGLLETYATQLIFYTLIFDTIPIFQTTQNALKNYFRSTIMHTYVN